MNLLCIWFVIGKVMPSASSRRQPQREFAYCSCACVVVITPGRKRYKYSGRQDRQISTRADGRGSDILLVSLYQSLPNCQTDIC